MKNLKAVFFCTAALAMSRAAQRVGEVRGDPGLVKAGKGLEMRAEAAFDKRNAVLDRIN